MVQEGLLQGPSGAGGSSRSERGQPGETRQEAAGICEATPVRSGWWRQWEWKGERAVVGLFTAGSTGLGESWSAGDSGGGRGFDLGDGYCADAVDRHGEIGKTLPWIQCDFPQYPQNIRLEICILNAQDVTGRT